MSSTLEQRPTMFRTFSAFWKLISKWSDGTFGDPLPIIVPRSQLQLWPHYGMELANPKTRKWAMLTKLASENLVASVCCHKRLIGQRKYVHISNNAIKCEAYRGILYRRASSPKLPLPLYVWMCLSLTNALYLPLNTRRDKNATVIDELARCPNDFCSCKNRLRTKGLRVWDGSSYYHSRMPKQPKI